MSETLINRVAESGLITIDLEAYYPDQEEMAVFDLKDYLFMGLVLKEKAFREQLRQVDWTVYRDKYVAVTCSADAIIPLWAYMLVTAYLQPVARFVLAGDAAQLFRQVFLEKIGRIRPEEYADQRVVVKGCGDKPIDAYAYAEITRLLLPKVRSILYGEPCSTVPVFRRK
ncbi:MAG TPA: DUF2480 family protein [Chitinophagaceae bacterium]|nr:DUF2480 family protein [Chitinophagaceae bacterium]